MRRSNKGSICNIQKRNKEAHTHTHTLSEIGEKDRNSEKKKKETQRTNELMKYDIKVDI